VIDSSRAPTRAPTPGPRLALADCPAEHWREEVLAAVECVWPRVSPSFFGRPLSGGAGGG
jgi:hypothetical protein